MFYFVILLRLCLAEEISIVTTAPDGVINTDGRFRMINVSEVPPMEAYTLCLRFKTYRFKEFQCLISSEWECRVMSLVGRNCHGNNDTDCLQRKSDLNVEWDVKKVFAVWLRKTVFKTWRPQIWNTLCWLVHHEKSNFKMIINGETAVDNSNYHADDDVLQFQYMNFRERHPVQGAVTDVQVWNRTLSGRDLEDWRLCLSKEEGNILNWRTARLNITGLTEQSIDKSELCHGPENDQIFQAFNMRLGFYESVAFCERFGTVATAKDALSFDKMIEAYEGIENRVCEDFGSQSGIIYREYTQYFLYKYILTHCFSDSDDSWIDYNTGQSLSIDNWHEGRPSNDTDLNDCIYFVVKKRTSYDYTCDLAECCPICSISKVGSLG